MFVSQTTIHIGAGYGTSEDEILWGPLMIWVPYKGWCLVKEDE